MCWSQTWNKKRTTCFINALILILVWSSSKKNLYWLIITTWSYLRFSLQGRVNNVRTILGILGVLGRIVHLSGCMSDLLGYNVAVDEKKLQKFRTKQANMSLIMHMCKLHLCIFTRQSTEIDSLLGPSLSGHLRNCIYCHFCEGGHCGRPDVAS